MASLPPPSTIKTATLPLIALALVLPQTRIGQFDGGCTMMRLICCCHGCCHWHHLCLNLQDNNAKDNGHSNRQGCHADIRGQKEVGHNNPISMEQQKQKYKHKQKQKQKQKQKPTTMVATSLPLHLQTATPELPLLLPLRKQEQQWQQDGGRGESSRPAESMILSARAECVCLGYRLRG
jgi:hypothetical protein